MDAHSLIDLLGIITAVQVAVMGALVKALWQHVMHCRRVETGLAEIRTDLKRIAEEIGTHEIGLRGSVHRHSNDIMRLDGRVSLLEARR